jgi:mono/diheme cytochrome c family protein
VEISSMGRERLTGQERVDERKSLAGLVERYQVTCPFHCHQCHTFVLYYPPSNLHFV